MMTVLIDQLFLIMTKNSLYRPTPRNQGLMSAADININQAHSVQIMRHYFNVCTFTKLFKSFTF